MKRIFITDYSAVCNLGKNIKEIFENAFQNEKSFLCYDENFIQNETYPFGQINVDLPQVPIPKFNIRCNQFLLHCLKQIDTERILNKYDKKRIGVIISTTNSGCEEYAKTENKEFLEMSNPAEFVKEYLELDGYFATISVACASGAKCFSTAKKLLDNNICDCVIVGGTDALAHISAYGFKSLELLSAKQSLPFSKNRTGINLGEAGALFVIEKEAINKNSIEVAGIGESSDAYHYSTPEPSGEQAIKAINIALNSASINPKDVDYINLHGTGTIANDLMEANAIYSIFKDEIPVSSTKPMTGHCLGAAASIEAALCCALLSDLNKENNIYSHRYDGAYDRELPQIRLAKENEKLTKLDTILSTSFGFGGANAVLILRRQNGKI